MCGYVYIYMCTKLYILYDFQTSNLAFLNLILLIYQWKTIIMYLIN